MAKFSETFIQGLLNPSYSERLGDAAEGVGALPGMMMAEKSRVASQAEIQQLLKQYANDPAQLTAMSQKYAAGGNKEAAKLFEDAATKATAQREGRGKGELMALANNPKFDITDQKMQGGYFGMANAFDVSREEAMEIALKAVEDREELSRDKRAPTYASVGDLFKDANDNVFTATERRTSTGVELIIQPVGHKQKQEGDLTPAGGAYGETAGDRLKRGIEAASEETKAKEFAKSQQVAVNNLPKIEIAIGDAEKSLALLPQIKTGGFTTAIARSAQLFLGVEPQTQAEFNLLAGKTVLTNLSSFPGAISEGERMYLERLYQSLERSGGANQAILENLLQEAQFLLADAKVKAGATSYKNYLDTRPTYSSVMSQQDDDGPKKVNFNDLK